LALGGAFVTLAIPLALSARWTALAWALEGLGLLALGGLALGGAFVTLAIPLALSARWTALAWALEGLGLL
ncbi:hypothetical protein, partial [Cronobacter sakazakii]|uniref:hypothetical protein n=1 Tax=Cronobacter sakazakii TaxID=28141 RepID=UPI001319E527